VFLPNEETNLQINAITLAHESTQCIKQWTCSKDWTKAMGKV
jgi:hypothetical protein